MKTVSRRRKHVPTFLLCTELALAVVFSFSMLSTVNAHAQASSVIVQQVSSDPFTNSTSQHQTQVEPGTFSFGSTVVSAFQSGRFDLGGGASGISWVTLIVPIYGFDLVTSEQGLYSYRSVEGGASWTDLLKISPPSSPPY